MNRYQNAAAVAVAACAMAVSATTAAQAAHAAPTPAQHRSTPTAAGEVDRNLVKPPPGGVLAPVTDVAGKLLPGR
ncbi:hypothetical protein ACWF94_33550 [Streptomyces sp. NPDC055078]